MTDFVGRKSAHPRHAFAGLKDGDSIHGLTDGTWDFVAAIFAVSNLTGTSDVTISTWTAARADIARAHKMLTTARFRTMRFIVDRSFRTRQPEYCDLIRRTFGDDAIRVANSHAKFAVFTGGDLDALYLTSANLNRNRRIENFTLFVGGELPGEYLALVEDQFALQSPGEGFTDPKAGRRTTKALLR